MPAAAAPARKLRKGTFSCGECKRRKKRCQYRPSSSSQICDSCQQHGTLCISQTREDAHCSEINRRLCEVEKLVDEVVKQRHSRWPTGHGITTYSARKSQRIYSPSPWTKIDESNGSKRYSLNGFLLSVFPSNDVAMSIATRGASRLALLERAPSSMWTSRRPERLECTAGNTRPVTLARDLIQLALCLDRLDLTASQDREIPVNGPPAAAARKYFDAARQVTCQDCMVDSSEGVEALMLESSYHMNRGNVQSAWILIRRALAVARLIDGTPRGCGDADAMWLRLIYFDRMLSLTTGQSDAMVTDCHSRFGVKQSKLGQLESMHLSVSSQIIARNLRLQKRCEQFDGDAVDDLIEETQRIDSELKRAVRALPTEWFALPSETHTTTSIKRLITQMQHYDLILLLHQPHLILHGSPNHSDYHEYSKFAAVAAGREVLYRFIACSHSRSAPRSPGGAIPKAFNASTLLLLAHIDGHRAGNQNSLDYLRAQDLNLIKETVAIIEKIVEKFTAVLYASHAHVLRKLLDLEQRAADGMLLLVSAGNEGSVPAEAALTFSIPYLGTICVYEVGSSLSIG